MRLLSEHYLYLACGAAILFSGLASAGLSQEDSDVKEPVTIGDIASAWSKREAYAKSFDFLATGKEFRSRQTLSEAELEFLGRPFQKGGISVPDMTFNIKLRAASDGKGRFRVDYDGRALVPVGNGYPDQHHIEISDRGLRKTVFLGGALEYPSAHIRKETTPTAAQDPKILPLLMVYRPFDKVIGVFAESDMKLARSKGLVDGHPCLILTYMENTLWVDPTRDYIPTRYHIVDKGVAVRSIDIKYAADPQHGWVPTSWNNTNLKKNGEIRDSITASIGEYRFGDSVTDETFMVHYPTGAWVRDYTRGESYILREDGSKREIRKEEEIGKEYNDLLHSNPSPKITSKRPWPWLAGIGLLLGISAAVLWYRSIKRVQDS